jgi:hypothetical protein
MLSIEIIVTAENTDIYIPMDKYAGYGSKGGVPRPRQVVLHDMRFITVPTRLCKTHELRLWIAVRVSLLVDK